MIAAFFVVGYALSLSYVRLVMIDSWLTAGIEALLTLIIPCGFLLIVRAVANRRGWELPRVGLVLVSLSVASLLRSPIGIIVVTEWEFVRSDEANPIGRAVVSLFITLGITLTLGASVHLARERGKARAVLLAEQARLRELVEATDESLTLAESELRGRASDLLGPTISEIRMLLQDRLSDAEAREVSARITEVVSEVVRPTSRQLAASPPFVLGALEPQQPAVFQ